MRDFNEVRSCLDIQRTHGSKVLPHLQIQISGLDVIMPALAGLVAMNILERRLEAAESVMELSKAKEVGSSRKFWS